MGCRSITSWYVRASEWERKRKLFRKFVRVFCVTSLFSDASIAQLYNSFLFMSWKDRRNVIPHLVYQSLNCYPIRVSVNMLYWLYSGRSDAIFAAHFVGADFFFSNKIWRGKRRHCVSTANWHTILYCMHNKKTIPLWSMIRLFLYILGEYVTDEMINQ